MFLALCLRECEGEMICDLAETYHILNYKEYPPLLVGTLLIGLRDDSRVKMVISGLKMPIERYLTAKAVDELSFIAWTHTKDARQKKNRPKSILAALLGETKKEEYATFKDMDEFQRMWNAI